MSHSAISEQQAAWLSPSFLTSVFGWMGLGMAITSLISYLVARSPWVLSMIVNENGYTPLGYVATFAPIGFVLLMSFGYRKLSYGVLLLLFLIYAGIMGISLSVIFLVYSSGSIYTTFGICSLMFGLMALIGYLTHRDLSSLGNMFLMALAGIIIASLVNMFLHNSVLDYAISFISVLVFCGLTTFDVQKIKNLTNDKAMQTNTRNKLGILGALTLYLDFINLFLSLLRLVGKRK